MRFVVRLLFHRGRIVPWRDVTNAVPLVGDLRIEKGRSEERRRGVRYATINATGDVRGGRELPTLYDPVLTGMSPLAFTLSGHESVDGVMYCQAWHVSNVERW